MMSLQFLLPALALGVGIALLFLSQRLTLQAWFSFAAATLIAGVLMFPDLFVVLGLPLVGDGWGLPGRVSVELVPGLSAWWLGLAALGPIARWSTRAFSPWFLPLAWLVAGIWQIALIDDPPLAGIVAGVLALAVAAPLLAVRGRPMAGGGPLFYAVLCLTLLLIANWQAQLSVVEPGVIEHALAATLALGIGCMLLLGAFPFHLWSPALEPDADTGQVALVALVLQPAALLMTLTLAQELSWFRSPLGVSGLRVAGLISVLAAGAMAFGELRLERVLGHALLLDVGAALLAITGQGPLDQQLVLAAIGVRVLGSAAWAAGLTTLRSHRESGTLSLNGVGLRFPLATAAFLAGPLAIGGHPLLAGFPLRWALLVDRGPTDPVLALAVLVGLIGIGFATFRSLTQLITPAGEAATLRFEDRGWPALIALAALAALLLAASYPQFWFWLFPVPGG